MGTCKEFLKDLEYYSMVENGLKVKKDENRTKYNFKRLMDEFETKKQNEQVKARYDANISKAKSFVEGLGIVHNTGLESIIGMIQNGGLLSIDEMEKRDISFNFRITFRGINDEMHKYVFGSTHKGDAIYGLYEIRLDKYAEELKANFLPKSYIEYGAEVLDDHFMDIKDWRTFLAEQIATTMDEPSKYLAMTPVHLRPEFLFLNQIPLGNVESITCVNEKAASELIRRIKKEFGENTEILNKIKVAE